MNKNIGTAILLVGLITIFGGWFISRNINNSTNQEAASIRAFYNQKISEVNKETALLLELNAKYKNASDEDKTGILSQMLDAAKARKDRIVELFSDESGLKNIYDNALSKESRNQFPDEVKVFIEEQGQNIIGNITVIHTEEEAFTHEERDSHFFKNPRYIHQLTLPSGDILTLYLPKGSQEKYRLITNAQITLADSIQIGDSIAAVTTVQYTDGIISAVNPLLSTARVEKEAVIGIIPSFLTPPNPGFTKPYLESLAFTGDSSNKLFWQNNSHGKLNMTGQVFGPYTINVSYPPYGSCGYEVSQDWIRLANRQASRDGFSASNFTKITYIVHGYVQAGYPNLVGGCGGGWGEIGGGRSFVGVVLNPTGTPPNYSRVFVHELGHNFGLPHGSKYSGCIGADGKYSDVNCSNESTSDSYNIMSYWGVPFMQEVNSTQRESLGWLEPSNLLTVTESGTYTISKPNHLVGPGVELLKIPYSRPDGTTRYFNLEFKSPVSGQTVSNEFLGSLTNAFRSVHIRQPDGVGIGSGTNFPGPGLIDMSAGAVNPNWNGGPGLEGLEVGQTFNDPMDSISFTLLSRDNTSAVVQVTIGQSQYVSPEIDSTAPIVRLISPTDGTNVKIGTNVTFTAEATDDKGLYGAYFFVNGTVYCNNFIGGLSVNLSCSAWKVPSGPGKKYKVTFMASDTLSNYTTSPEITVTSVR